MVIEMKEMKRIKEIKNMSEMNKINISGDSTETNDMTNVNDREMKKRLRCSCPICRMNIENPGWEKRNYNLEIVRWFHQKPRKNNKRRMSTPRRFHFG